MSTDHRVHDAVNFSDTPENLWGSYGIVVDFTHPDRNMVVEVFINGHPSETIEFTPEARRDLSGRFELEKYEDTKMPSDSPLRAVLEQWMSENP